MPRRSFALLPKLVSAVLVVAALPAAAAEVRLAPGDRTGLDLVIYQEGLALVRDRRAATFDKGESELVLEGVAADARPGSFVLAGPGLAVKSQTFSADTVSAERLLELAVGREVGVVWRDGGKEERARVLAAGPVPVFDVDGRIVAGQPLRIIHDRLPAGMRSTPELRAALAAEKAGRRDLELSYLADGVSWSADYVAELAPDGERMTLAAWATLDNAGRSDYADARIQVVAGTMNRLAGQPRGGRMEMAAAMAGPAADAQRAAFGPYHVYDLGGNVALKAGERKQLALMAPAVVTATRELVLDPQPPHVWRDRVPEGEPRHPLATLTFKNAGALGKPLPQGAIRVYARAKDGALALMGEDRLAAIPAGQTARVSLGQAFDITARRAQTDFNRVAADVTEAAFEVRLANAGERPATVTVRESFGGDWLVIDSSQPHVKENAFTVSWAVPIPARGEAILKYRARVKG